MSTERTPNRVNLLRNAAMLTAFIAAVVGCSASEPAGPAAVAERETDQSEEKLTIIKETLGKEHLKTEIPEGWLLVLDTKTSSLHVSEYVPPDTGDQWRQKLSIESLSGDHLPDPLEFVNGWAADQSELCSEFVDHPIFTGFENGYETVVRLLECRINKRTRLPIVTMLKVIRGQSSLYTVTRIWRLDVPAQKDQPLALSGDAIAQWSNALSKTLVCDPSNADHNC